jgi:hypothetical protein
LAVVVVVVVEKAAEAEVLVAVANHLELVVVAHPLMSAPVISPAS